MIHRRSTDPIPIAQVTIIGLGLMGGSLAGALRAKICCQRIVGYSRSAAALDVAKAREWIDEGTTNLKAAVADAQVVVLAVPIDALSNLLQQLAPLLASATVVTDMTSVKEAVVSLAEQYLPATIPFIPGHPLAGSEQSGIEAARDDLYTDQLVLLTPDQNTDQQALQLITNMWQYLGAQVKQMTAAEHDKVLAATSHLPHLLAYCLMNVLADQEKELQPFEYSGGGLRDTTRIAASDPKLWQDILLNNDSNVIVLLDKLQQQLESYKQILAQRKTQELLALLTKGQSARQRLQALFQTRTEENEKETF